MFAEYTAMAIRLQQIRQRLPRPLRWVAGTLNTRIPTVRATIRQIVIELPVQAAKIIIVNTKGIDDIPRRNRKWW